MKKAGLIFDDSRHYIDHLAPFCAINKWPLIVCEGVIEDLARLYYPDLEVIRINYWDLSLPETIVSCDTKSLIKSSLGISIQSQLHWLPHGNSDKGWKSSFFEALEGEDTALVYGQKMIDFIKQTKVSIPTRSIGNFRADYWIKHQLFYSQLLEKKIELPSKTKTYLYAPTWDDREGNGSFWQTFPNLIQALPDHYNLIIKIHPNTYLKYLVEIEQLIGQFKNQKNIFFLTDFPPIYPLLSICDAYIGDMSSIGYDFLKFNRPMFFINNKQEKSPRQFLYRCGITLQPEQISSLFDLKEGEFSKIRKEIYEYTFS